MRAPKLKITLRGGTLSGEPQEGVSAQAHEVLDGHYTNGYHKILMLEDLPLGDVVENERD